MHHPKDEQSLATSLKAGSVKAFEAIYRLYVDRLYAYCFDAIRMKQETEEVVHDVFLALWESRDNIEPDKGVGRLLFTIARKRRIDAFRKLVNSPIYEDYIEHQNSLPHRSIRLWNMRNLTEYSVKRYARCRQECVQ